MPTTPTACRHLLSLHDLSADEARTLRLHDGKRELLKIMSYKGNQDLADDWQEAFKLAWAALKAESSRCASKD